MEVWVPIIVAIISAIGSFLGVYLSNRKSASLIEFRVQKLEEEIKKYNNVKDRVDILEKHSAVVDERIRTANEKIAGLEHA